VSGFKDMIVCWFELASRLWASHLNHLLLFTSTPLLATTFVANA